MAFPALRPSFLLLTDFLILNCVALCASCPLSRTERAGLCKDICLCGTILPDHPDSLEVGMASPDVHSETGWTLFNPSGSWLLSKRLACP